MKELLRQYNLLSIQKAMRIKAFIFDVDGVLTNGQLIYEADGGESKAFHAQDGYGIKMLKKAGMLCGTVSGRDGAAVDKRAEDLQMDFAYHGIGDKLAIYEQIKKDFALQDIEIAVMGDDIIDLPMLSRCGLAMAPANGLPYVCDFADLVTQRTGGAGAAREAIDFILAAQGHLQSFIDEHLHNSSY